MVVNRFSMLRLELCTGCRASVGLREKSVVAGRCCEADGHAVHGQGARFRGPGPCQLDRPRGPRRPLVACGRARQLRLTGGSRLCIHHLQVGHFLLICHSSVRFRIILIQSNLVFFFHLLMII